MNFGYTFNSMNNRRVEMPPLKSINFNFEMRQEGQNSMFMGLLSMYYAIFNDKSQFVDLKKLLPFQEIKMEGTLCNK